MNDGRVTAKVPLHVRILIGLALGVVGGVTANAVAGGAPWLVWTTDHVVEPFGRLFLRLIFMVVLPLVFSALTLGVAGLGDVSASRRKGSASSSASIAFSTCAGRC